MNKRIVAASKKEYFKILARHIIDRNELNHVKHLEAVYFDLIKLIYKIENPKYKNNGIYPTTDHYGLSNSLDRTREEIQNYFPTVEINDEINEIVEARNLYLNDVYDSLGKN